MGKYFYIIFFFIFTLGISAQVNSGFGKPFVPGGGQSNGQNDLFGNNQKSKDTVSTIDDFKKAPIDWYKVITLENDTTYVDTSLNIHKNYIFNILRRDNFGLLAFANEGQTYNTLYHGLDKYNPYPEFGFDAKQFNYLQANQIKYYSVPTPLTELYYKTVMNQGQSLDAFITLNTSERFNFSIAYKGLHSLGKYVNQVANSGNFRFTSNYMTKDNRYWFKSHIVSQFIDNYENGGIVRLEDFESNSPEFQDRARLQVYLNDARSILKGNRFFIDHGFRINKNKSESSLVLSHQLQMENKIFEFNQPTLTTTITNYDGSTSIIKRFGDSYVNSNLKDKTWYNRVYNKLTLEYDQKLLGKFGFYADDFHYNYYFDSYIVVNGSTIPSSLNGRINTVGGFYKYQKGNWNGNFLYSNSLTNQSLSNLDLSLGYAFDEDNQVSFQIQKMNKLPDHNYNLYQSSYINYNWFNDFKNEKVNNIQFKAETEWLDATVQYSVLNDKLYFSNDSVDGSQLLISPKQYGGAINYFSAKVGKEFTFGKWALDNTFLYQKVQQSANVLNVPEFLTRNSLYYSDELFKKAMFLQTGVTLNYFTKYYANDYNPLMGEFYVQTQRQIGNFPMLDYFVDAKIRQTRIYLIAEHFNSLFGQANYYTAPNYPYRDFIVRFGLVWNFFR